MSFVLLAAWLCSNLAAATETRCEGDTAEGDEEEEEGKKVDGWAVGDVAAASLPAETRECGDSVDSELEVGLVGGGRAGGDRGSLSVVAVDEKNLTAEATSGLSWEAGGGAEVEALRVCGVRGLRGAGLLGRAGRSVSIATMRRERPAAQLSAQSAAH